MPVITCLSTAVVAAAPVPPCAGPTALSDVRRQCRAEKALSRDHQREHAGFEAVLATVAGVNAYTRLVAVPCLLSCYASHTQSPVQVKTRSNGDH